MMIIASKMTNHCVGAVQIREMSEKRVNGIGKH